MRTSPTHKHTKGNRSEGNHLHAVTDYNGPHQSRRSRITTKDILLALITPAMQHPDRLAVSQSRLDCLDPAVECHSGHGEARRVAPLEPFQRCRFCGDRLRCQKAVQQVISTEFQMWYLRQGGACTHKSKPLR